MRGPKPYTGPTEPVSQPQGAIFALLHLGFAEFMFARIRADMKRQGVEFPPTPAAPPKPRLRLVGTDE